MNEVIIYWYYNSEPARMSIRGTRIEPHAVLDPMPAYKALATVLIWLENTPLHSGPAAARRYVLTLDEFNSLVGWVA